MIKSTKGNENERRKTTGASRGDVTVMNRLSLYGIYWRRAENKDWSFRTVYPVTY